VHEDQQTTNHALYNIRGSVKKWIISNIYVHEDQQTTNHALYNIRVASFIIN